MRRVKINRSCLGISSLLTALAFLFAAHLVLAAPTPLKFHGSATTPDKRQNIAFADWDAHIGRPTRTVTFDNPDLFKKTAQGQLAIKSGGDLALLVSPAFIVQDTHLGGFQGVGNVDDLSRPNINSLVPGASGTIAFNFLDRLDNGSPTFGTTEAVGGFVSTLGAATLEIFDFNGNSLGSITKAAASTNTSGSTAPFFLGFVFPDDKGQQPIIARAEFRFETDGVFDGLVFTSVNAMLGQPRPPVVISPPPDPGVQ